MKNYTNKNLSNVSFNQCDVELYESKYYFVSSLARNLLELLSMQNG